MSWLFTPEQIRAAFPISPWEHQMRSVEGTVEMLKNVNALTLCLPTAAGKTNCAAALINLASQSGMKAMMLSNRKMLTQQLSDGMTKFGIEHGVRAASLPGRVDLLQNVQISSMQTEMARSIKSSKWLKHQADLIIIDEGHQFCSGDSLRFIQSSVAEGAKVVLLTGTPVGMSHVTPHLLVGAKNSELRACGAHVPAIVKCISEFDVSKVVRKKVPAGSTGEGDFTDASIRDWFKRQQQIVGVVYRDWVRFNPIGKMTLGVAPGSEEAITLAEEFWRHGTTSAAITAQGVWANGKLYNDDPGGKTRMMIDEDWQAGNIKVMWNRFVYREAIDRPSLYHLILATPIGSLKSYIQTCGRVIRKSPKTPDHVLITDHAGSFFEHGSPNEDRDWEEIYTMTEGEIRAKRKKKNIEDAQKGEEPICCPKCGTVLRKGRCPPQPIGCGELLTVTNPNRMRTVIQEDGTLVEVDNMTRLGEAKKKVAAISQEQKQWNSIFWASRKSAKSKLTFKQARMVYFNRYGDFPSKNLKLMPKNPRDYERIIKAVDMSSLYG